MASSSFYSPPKSRYKGASGTGTSTGGTGTDGTAGTDNNPPMPKPTDKRPPGDTRTAEEIIDDNPVLKNLGHQKDIDREGLKKQCGDWEHDPDPAKRADAAYRVAEVLKYIDSSKSAKGLDRGPVAGDGDIQGITKSGDARHGTEAGLLKDFAKNGYGALKADHRLDTTKDSHVRENGTNKDNFEWGFEKAMKYLKFLEYIPLPIGRAFKLVTTVTKFALHATQKNS